MGNSPNKEAIQQAEREQAKKQEQERIIEYVKNTISKEVKSPLSRISHRQGKKLKKYDFSLQSMKKY